MSVADEVNELRRIVSGLSRAIARLPVRWALGGGSGGGGDVNLRRAESRGGVSASASRVAAECPTITIVDVSNDGSIGDEYAARWDYADDLPGDGNYPGVAWEDQDGITWFINTGCSPKTIVEDDEDEGDG